MDFSWDTSSFPVGTGKESSNPQEVSLIPNELKSYKVKERVVLKKDFAQPGNLKVVYIVGL